MTACNKSKKNAFSIFLAVKCNSIFFATIRVASTGGENLTRRDFEICIISLCWHLFLMALACGKPSCTAPSPKTCLNLENL